MKKSSNFCNCREHVGEWDEDDFPHTEHRSLFPHCPFVRGMDVGNIASNAESRETFERLGLVHSQSQHEGLARTRVDPSRDLAPNRSHDQRYRRNSSNIQSRPDPSSLVRLRPNSGRSSTSWLLTALILASTKRGGFCHPVSAEASRMPAADMAAKDRILSHPYASFLPLHSRRGDWPRPF